MPTPFVVAIDQGTSATKAYRLDAAGRFTRLNSIAHAQHYPRSEEHTSELQSPY